MRFSTTVKSLHDALKRTSQLTQSTTSLIAYSGVLLQVKDLSLDVTSSDGDSSMTVTLPVTDSADGSVLLIPRPIISFLAALPASSNVSFELTTSGDLLISGTGINPYTFRPLSATFPVPNIPATGIHPDGLSGLLAALQAVKPAVDRNNAIVQLVSDADQLVLHATDGFRLARATLPTAGFGTFTGVLALPMLERISLANPTEVTVDIKGRTLSFRGLGVLISSRLLATTFPAVEAVLAATPPAVSSFSATILSAALARLAAIAEEGTLSLEFKASELHIRASAAEVGTGSEVVPLLTPAPAPFQLQIRAPYLQQAVDVMGDSPVTVAYSGSLQPLHLSVTTPFPLTHVVMPVRN